MCCATCRHASPCTRTYLRKSSRVTNDRCVGCSVSAVTSSFSPEIVAYSPRRSPGFAIFTIIVFPSRFVVSNFTRPWHTRYAPRAVSPSMKSIAPSGYELTCLIRSRACNEASDMLQKKLLERSLHVCSCPRRACRKASGPFFAALPRLDNRKLDSWLEVPGSPWSTSFQSRSQLTTDKGASAQPIRRDGPSCGPLSLTYTKSAACRYAGGISKWEARFRDSGRCVISHSTV